MHISGLPKAQFAQLMFKPPDCELKCGSLYSNKWCYSTVYGAFTSTSHNPLEVLAIDTNFLFVTSDASSRNMNCLSDRQNVKKIDAMKGTTIVDPAG